MKTAVSGALVVGYGNTLRGDDAIGPRVAEAVQAARWPGVRALAVPQLTPELAEPLSDAERAIFVDSWTASVDVPVLVRPLIPVAASFALGHASDPAYLLGLAQSLYGRCPPAWCVLVPGVDFELGEGLSARAAGGIEAALAAMRRLLGEREKRCTKSA